MDLFTIVTEDLTAPEDLDERVERLCLFVSELHEEQLKVIDDFRAKRDFDSWEKAVRGVYSLAQSQGLTELWRTTMATIEERKRKEFWHSGWDSAFDCAAAMLMEPWEGKTWSHQDYLLLTAPLVALGFSLNTVEAEDR